MKTLWIYSLCLTFYLSNGEKYYFDTDGDCKLAVFPNSFSPKGQPEPSAATRQECEEACVFQPLCWAFDWTEKTKKCTTHYRHNARRRKNKVGTVQVRIGQKCKLKKRVEYIGCFFHKPWASMIIETANLNEVGKIDILVAVKRCGALNFRYAAITGDKEKIYCGDQFHGDGGLAIECGSRQSCIHHKYHGCDTGDKMRVYELFRRQWKNGIKKLRVKEMGCYRDSKYIHDLPFTLGDDHNFGFSGLSWNFCAGICKAAKRKYAGLQGHMCYCGRSYGHYGKSKGCATCFGGPYWHKCGQKYTNTVLQINRGRVVRNPRFRKLGCFSGEAVKDARLMFEKYARSRSKRRYLRQNPETCIRFCFAAGLRYAAMQHGRCYCGGVFGEKRRLPDQRCNFKCRNRSPKGLSCGGKHNSYIYQLGKDYCPIKGYSKVWNKMYLGCYKDKPKSKSGRDFEFRLLMKEWPGLTLDRCIPACKTLGYKYAALQGTMCFCGNSFGRHGKLDDQECSGPDLTCGGDLLGACGDFGKSAVYDTRLGKLTRCSREVDHCKGKINCDKNAECISEPGSYTCKCKPGYHGNGTEGHCSHSDECKPGNPDCHSDAKCVYQNGAYDCVCNLGFDGNGKLCSDIDECKSNPCENNAKCINQVNAFKCDCNGNFTGDRCENNLTSPAVSAETVTIVAAATVATVAGLVGIGIIAYAVVNDAGPAAGLVNGLKGLKKPKNFEASSGDTKPSKSDGQKPQEKKELDKKDETKTEDKKDQKNEDKKKENKDEKKDEQKDDKKEEKKEEEKKEDEKKDDGASEEITMY